MNPTLEIVTQNDFDAEYSEYIKACEARDAIKAEMEASKTISEVRHHGARLIHASLTCGILKGELND